MISLSKIKDNDFAFYNNLVSSYQFLFEKYDKVCNLLNYI